MTVDMKAPQAPYLGASVLYRAGQGDHAVDVAAVVTSLAGDGFDVSLTLLLPGAVDYRLRVSYAERRENQLPVSDTWRWPEPVQ